MKVFFDALLDALIDSALIIPFLYLTYLLVSYFSHNDNEKYSKILHKTNKAGPAIGAFLGSIPQCGFSSVMSSLYSKKMVTLGTLIAVFISTSDEAVPLMISKPEFIPKLLLLVAAKIVFAVVFGYIIDGIFKLFSKKQVERQYHDRHCHDGGSEDIIVETHSDHCHHCDEELGGHEHKDEHCCATNIFLDALKHTLVILSYVFLVTLAINLIKGYCGGLEPLNKLFTSNIYLQILLACVFGLIPNCAASVFLVELYMQGVILFPALLAGLSAGAGVGLIVLYTSNYKKIGANIFITILLFGLAFLTGIISNFIPIW